MFSIPRANVIECDEGFSIEILGLVGMLYREGPKIMKINSEVLTTPAIQVYEYSLKTWEPPYDKELIDKIKREQIIENIRRALSFKGEKLYVN